jgi:hypothetical protein
MTSSASTLSMTSAVIVGGTASVAPVGAPSGGVPDRWMVLDRAADETCLTTQFPTTHRLRFAAARARVPAGT